MRSALAQVEPLSREQEQSLFTKYRFFAFRRSALESTTQFSQGGRKISREITSLTQQQEAVRNQILESHLRLLAALVRRISPSAQDYDDFFSEGSAVMLKAIETFDPDRGFRFSTYVTHAVERHLANYSIRSQRRGQNEISDGTLAERVTDANPASAGTSQETDLIADWLREQVHQLLDDRERAIVRARIGLPPYDAAHSFQAIGDELDLSKERVRQIYQQAIQKLERTIRPELE